MLSVELSSDDGDEHNSHSDQRSSLEGVKTEERKRKRGKQENGKERKGRGEERKKERKKGEWRRDKASQGDPLCLGIGGDTRGQELKATCGREEGLSFMPPASALAESPSFCWPLDPLSNSIPAPLLVRKGGQDVAMFLII